MEDPASSGGSRKRPWSAVAGAAGGDGDGGDPKSDEVSRDVASPKESDGLSGHAVPVPVSVGKDGRDGNCSESDDDDESDDEDVAEITDLQRALEYLVTERDIERVYNCDAQQPQKSNGDQDIPQSNADSADVDRRDGGKDDEQLYMIPNLVNRILMEHYSPSNQRGTRDKNNDASAKMTDMTRSQTHKMTQLLLAVIVEFSEPYFARTARRRQREREQKQKQRQEKKQKAKKPQSDASATKREEQSSSGFAERAVSWATSCIKQLLQPAPSISPPARKSTASILSDNADPADEARIPELDALLAATGPHDGMEMELRMQDAMLRGLRARRLLERSGVATDFERTKLKSEC